MRVRVKPGDAPGSFEVELEGEIAAMAELAQRPERNKAVPGGTAVRDAFRRSVKLAAEVRNTYAASLSEGS